MYVGIILIIMWYKTNNGGYNISLSKNAIFLKPQASRSEFSRCQDLSVSDQNLRLWIAILNATGIVKPPTQPQLNSTST